MPKKLFGKKVPERYWKTAKKLAKKNGFTIKDNKEQYYKYVMGILKQMMRLNETVVAGDVAIPIGTKPLKKWSNIIKQEDKE